MVCRERSCRGGLSSAISGCRGGLSSAAILGSGSAREGTRPYTIALAHEDTRLYTIAHAREDTRLYMLRAVDIDDLALIRPIFRAVHQARATWIFADVFPFLCVTFIVAQ